MGKHLSNAWRHGIDDEAGSRADAVEGSIIKDKTVMHSKVVPRPFVDGSGHFIGSAMPGVVTAEVDGSFHSKFDEVVLGESEFMTVIFMHTPREAAVVEKVGMLDHGINAGAVATTGTLLDKPLDTATKVVKVADTKVIESLH